MFTLGLEAFSHDEDDLFRADLIEHLAHLLDHRASRLHKVKQRLASIKTKLPVVELREKFSFFLGVNNLCLIIWTLFSRPDLVPPAYAICTLVLLPLRFWLYYQKAWHYFMLDLCYWTNVLVLGYLFLFPGSPQVMSAAFMLSNGPVIWAVVSWKNALVFHSLDKTTSCMIHISPCVVMYAIRWGVDPSYRSERFPGAELDSIMLLPSMLGALMYYVVWQGAYYVMIEVFKKEKVASGERVTSFTYIATLAESRKNWVWRILTLMGGRRKVLMFMLLQLTYAVVTMVPTVLLWNHQWLHFGLLLLMFWTALWNGASFYIDVFGKSYADRYRTIQQEVVDCYTKT